MIDLAQLRRTIEAAPENGDAATVTRGFLEQVERELSTARSQTVPAVQDGTKP